MHTHHSRYRRFALSVAVFITCSSAAPLSYAIDFGDMMNPNRWLNGTRDRNDAPPPPPPPSYAPPYVAPPPYYHPTPGAPAAVSPTSAADKAEIDALKRRIAELEAQQRTPVAQPAPRGLPTAPVNELPAAPVFRPLDKN
jgi:hypothetical protein